VSISYRTAAVIGPGLGGLLVVTLGSTTLAFAANVVAFVVGRAPLTERRYFGLRAYCEAIGPDWPTYLEFRSTCP
jgi:hypothetical protein